jgi:hypothetical protein
MKQNGASESSAPAVPDTRFREELQRALEQTHRQQLVQRQLESDKKRELAGARRQLLSLVPNGLAALALVALAFGLGFYLGRRR